MVLHLKKKQGIKKLVKEGSKFYGTTCGDVGKIAQTQPKFIVDNQGLLITESFLLTKAVLVLRCGYGYQYYQEEI